MFYNIKIVSLNVRGLGVYNKRKLIYEQLRENKADLILLQETHGSKESAQQWKTEWGGDWYDSFGSSQARGVSTLVNRNFRTKMEKIKLFRDGDGRILIIQFTIDEILYVVANVYGPNTDSPEFYQEVIDLLKPLEFDNLVIGGGLQFSYEHGYGCMESQSITN